MKRADNFKFEICFCCRRLSKFAHVPPDTTKSPTASPPAAYRITSIDALRGFVMFMMIFVNDLAGAPHELVPDWMVHFSDRHRGGSGMTFVDLVFPAFLFIVGMSIPFALGSRSNKGIPLWKTILHILARGRLHCWRSAF